MPKDTKTLGNSKARACESLGFVHKKGCARVLTQPRATTRTTGSIRTIGNGRIVSQRSCQYHRNISQHFIITKTLCRHSPSQTAERTV